MFDPIDEFLVSTELEAMQELAESLQELTPDEQARVIAVIDEWDDGQAVSNLLFYPNLIPESARFDAIDRALHSFGETYYLMAAVVGIRSINVEALDDHQSRRWFRSMLNLLRSPNATLACCASVTLDMWADPYNIAELAACVPLRDEIVHTNILAVVLRMFGDRDRASFVYVLREMGLGDFKRKLYLEFYETYHTQAPGSPATQLMTTCQNTRIPSYVEYLRER